MDIILSRGLFGLTNWDLIAHEARQGRILSRQLQSLAELPTVIPNVVYRMSIHIMIDARFLTPYQMYAWLTWSSWWRHQMETFYWPFVGGIHRSPVNSPHKGQWRGALIFSLISAWINGWVNNGEAGDLIHHRTHYDVTVMYRDINPGHIYNLWFQT